MDFYLKFNDKEQADSILYTVTEESSKPNFANIDVIGTMYEATPEDAPEDYVPVAFDGWHINIRAVGNEDTSALTEFSVVPKFPRRIWG